MAIDSRVTVTLLSMIWPRLEKMELFGHEVWKGPLGAVHSLNNWSTEHEESSK